MSESGRQETEQQKEERLRTTAEAAEKERLETEKARLAKEKERMRLWRLANPPKPKPPHGVRPTYATWLSQGAARDASQRCWAPQGGP